ncbi:unnamed protein product [Closterium sp. NIES-53]
MARYVARGFSKREGDDFFQTFSPTLKMTTLRVLQHIAAQRDCELHSLDFTTAFLQGSLHEAIWLRHPRAFTGSFPKGTQSHHPGQSTPHHHPHSVRNGAAGPSALRLHMVLATAHSSVYRPLALSSTFGQVRRAEWSPELVGCLMYLMTCTRPDLAYTLSLLARYVAPSRYRKVHLETLKRVLHYMCSRSGMGLMLGGLGSVVLTGHSDAS